MQIDSSCTALVTGANGGLGQAIARALHGAGAKLVLSGRRADALAGIAAETGARVIVADLAERQDVKRLADEAGEIDIFVANAGLPATGLVADFDERQIDRALDVNLRAPIILTRRFALGMQARRRGHIVLVSSIAGKVASPGGALYSGTKYGLRGFGLGLRQDLLRDGVGVTGIFPGFIRDAGMFADAKVELAPGMGTKTPEDVARAVLRAVRENPAEIDVAAVDQRVGAILGALSPSLSEFIQTRFGMELSRKLDEAQRHKR
jgi:uncharacterized protein